MQQGANYDLMIAGIAAPCLIFIIMLVITRAVVAAAVIVGTVVLSLGTSVRAFGAHLARPHRPATALDGARYVGDHPVGRRIRLQPAARRPLQRGNPRRPEHRHHQGNGRQRLRGDLGGLVFALTMASMAFSELRILAQVGTTIGLGLMFDTLINPVGS